MCEQTAKGRAGSSGDVLCLRLVSEPLGWGRVLQSFQGSGLLTRRPRGRGGQPQNNRFVGVTNGKLQSREGQQNEDPADGCYVGTNS